MGCLQLNAGLPNFSKAVVSLWFRVPTASLDAAVADYASRTGGPSLLLRGVIPLLTFGAKGVYTSYNTNVGHEAENFTSDIGPSFIGIRCGPQRADHGGSTAHTLCTRIQYDASPIWRIEPDPLDQTSNTNAPHHFQVGGFSDLDAQLGGPDQNASFIEVTPDVWHHVLVSFDMTGGSDVISVGGGNDCSFGRVCRFWWAFDDVNYNGAYLTPYGAACYQPFTADANSIVSQYAVYGNGDPTNDAHFAFDAGAISTIGHPVGIPSDSSNASFIYKIETSELRIFTDVTLDTSVEDNRRAFIKADGTPQTDYSIAERILGKSAGIKLSGANFWKAGVNNGTLGGTFAITGTITSYETAPDITP